MMKAFSQVVMMAGLASAQDGTSLVKFLDTSQNVTLIPKRSPTASMNWTMESEISIR